MNHKASYLRELHSNHGFALIAVLMMMMVLLALLGAYSLVTQVELGTHRASKDSLKGFYAAEAGLNLRAEVIRQTFIGYNRPNGTSPTESDNPCTAGNMGTGHFACAEHQLGNHRAVSYVVDETGPNPLILTIPPGERYQNLNAQEYRYTTVSKAFGPKGDVEAILELRFKSRLVPLFQFAVFYNKDLEILPGVFMNLAGPVHTNGDLYLQTEDTLEIAGQVTTSGKLYRGRKNQNICLSRPVKIKDPGAYRTLIQNCSTRVRVLNENVEAWNGMIQIGVPVVTVPEPEDLDPVPGKTYWDKADLRLVLVLNSSNVPDTTHAATGIEVRNANSTLDAAKTASLNSVASCPGGVPGGRSVGYSKTFYSNREGSLIHMLEVDMIALLNCIHNYSLMGAKALNDDTEGGLVFHFSVSGPNSTKSASNYGIRLSNAAKLQSNVSGAPIVKGITVITDQAIFTRGNYNSVNKIPAALLADSYNALSTAWVDSNKTWASRTPADTTVYAAILAGTDVTGGVEGYAGQDKANYNGGLENYPRFHEDWAKSPKKSFYYKGSFVSLNAPRHASGAWLYGNPQYSAPNRYWSYDTDFNDAKNLPPITPRFVYLRQQLFLREYEQ